MKIRDQWGLVDEKMHPQHSAKIRDKAPGPSDVNSNPVDSFAVFTKRIRCTI